MTEKTFKWVVEFEVDELWVADGFELDDERACEMIMNDLRYAKSGEARAKVIKSPNQNAIRRVQGYPVREPVGPM